jgi:hypothetical protein
MALGDEIDEIFRREVKSLPAYAKAQAGAVRESHRRWTR